MKEKSIGKILLKARQKAKISQDLLAQQLHISRQSISNWENGNGLPDLDMLKTLCDKLDLNYKKILKKYPSHSVNNKTKKIIINFVYNINNKQLTCYSDSCKDYEKYLNILFDEYKKLIN